MDIDKINRAVFFIHGQILETQSTDNNTTWVYKRAPEGYVYQLVAIDISTTQENSHHEGIIAMFDGHEYTHWNIYPGVVSHEYLARFETSDYQVNDSRPLHNWECKEYTLAVRSTNITYPFKSCVIVWFYLKKMSRFETFSYAIRHPRWRIRKGSASTLEPKDE